MNEWYYGKAGQQQGPVSAEKLKELMASGQLNVTDLVWKEGMGEWKPYQEISGLMNASESKSEPSSPYDSPATSPASAQPQPHAVSQKPTNGLAIASMVCGIIAFPTIFCYIGLFISIAAIIMGHIARKQIRESQGIQSGDGMALSGIIMGYIGAVLSLCYVILIFVVVKSGMDEAMKQAREEIEASSQNHEEVLEEAQPASGESEPSESTTPE